MYGGGFDHEDTISLLLIDGLYTRMMDYPDVVSAQWPVNVTLFVVLRITCRKVPLIVIKVDVFALNKRGENTWIPKKVFKLKLCIRFESLNKRYKYDIVLN